MRSMQKNRKKFYRSGRNTNNTALQSFKWQRGPHKPDKCTSMLAVKWEKETQKFLRTKPRRRAVGWIRAFRGPHFFAGSHAGAEND